MLETIFMILFLVTAVLLSMLVLVQRGRGGGLAGAFGGAGGSSAFGTKTADIFIKATAVLGGVFFLLAIVTAYMMKVDRQTTVPPVQPTEAPAPANPGSAAPAPAAPAAPVTPPAEK
ncbi:MAG: preprotein translocase subunit SecG [Planctomycetota bacterium]|nr:preprotein translocase subunit SecG [Planctomycetota bacterium]